MSTLLAAAPPVSSDLNGSGLREGPTLDRRRKPTSPWGVFRRRGRRVRQRRLDEHRRPYFVDRFSKQVWCLCCLFLAFSLFDAVATLWLLDAGCTELNPVMSFLLRQGAPVFLIGKLTMTVAALPILLICRNFYLFGTKLRVSALLPMFVALYATLNVYQFVLFFLV